MLFRSRIGSKQILLLLDALDEVPSKNNLKKNLLSRLGTWVEASPQARVWITSRHANYQAPWAIRQNDREREVELLPFDDDQITAFIEAWFGQEMELAEKMRQLIRENPQLRGMAELPLLLGFICLLYRDEASRSHQMASNPDSIAQRSRSKIYEEIVKKLLYKEWHHDYSEVIEGEEPQNKTFILFQAQELLEELAFRLFLEDKVQFSQKTLVKLLKEIVTNHNHLEGSATKAKNEDILRLIKELSQERGLLIEGGNTSGSNLQYLFLHLTIQEYLCASFLARTINSEGWANAKLLNTGQLIENLINKKSWDSRWEQVLLLLSSILKDPFPLINLLKNSRIDDVFKHRQALALHCLGEIWLEPELIGNPIRLHQLETIRNQIGEDVISTWHRYEDRKSVALIPHLRTAIPVLIRIKGQYKQKTILNHLFSVLQSTASSGIKKASVNLIQKAKYELIGNAEYMQLFMDVLSKGQEDTKETLFTILEEASLELFQTTYFPRILTQFIEEAKPESLVLIMKIVLQAVEHLKGSLNQIHELKEEYLTQPTAKVRKQVSKLIDQASPVFLFYLISEKLYRKSDEPLDVLDSMQYILDRQKAILMPPTVNSFAFEPADQEALDLVLEAINIQNSLEINFEDEEAFLKSLEEIEIGDLKLKDIVKIYNDEMGQLMDDEDMRKVFWYMVAKMLKKGGLSGLLQDIKKPETITEHMPKMINAMNKILEGEHLPLKSIVLEGIVDMYQEKDQYELSSDVSMALNEAFENIKHTILRLITSEENPELVKELTLANLKMLDFANDVQQYILTFQELNQAGELEEQFGLMRNILSKLMRRLWKEESFITAYADVFVNMDPKGISTEEEFQQALWSYPALIDTVLDIYHATNDDLVKADIIEMLRTQREGYYRYNKLMDCLEESLLSNDQELQLVCLEVLANVGHEIILRPKIFQFLCGAITQKKNIKLAIEATKAVREVTRANTDVLDQWKDELLQLTQILMQTFLETKNNDLRLSAALSLYQFSESRYRFFFKEPETWAGKLLSGILPKKYEIKSIKSLTGIEL